MTHDQASNSTDNSTHDPLCPIEQVCAIGSRDGYHVLYETHAGLLACDCCERECNCSPATGGLIEAGPASYLESRPVGFVLPTNDPMIREQLADTILPEPCEDCTECEGWACKGNAQYVPLPVERRFP